MKKLLFVMCCLGLMNGIFAETFYGPINLKEQNVKKDVEVYGPATFNKVRLDSLTVKGPLTFTDLDVDGDADIIGPVLKSQKGKFDSLSILGPFQADFVKAKKLKVIGPVDVSNLIVSGDVDILGEAKLRNAKVGELFITGTFHGDAIDAEKLKVMGPVDITNLTVKGHSEITGPVVASRSSFEDLTLYANEIRLNDVQTKDIDVKTEDEGPQTIYLSGKTFIKGDIEFKSKKGIVVVQGQDVQIKGDIKGGIRK